MEFHENMRFMKSLPLEPVGDVLVIAGDVGYLVDTTIPHLRFWKWASENYRQVLMIAGNHEYYNNGDIAAQGESWQKMYMPNVGSFRKISTMNSSETSRSSKRLWLIAMPKKIVVVTHHLPTFAAIEDRHKGSVLNAAYATELGNYIADSRISAWIYGHSHHTTDLTIGNTRLVSNPLGYLFCGENTAFNDSAVIEI